MAEVITKICPYCKSQVTENDEAIVCTECEIPHHKSCWEENKGCSTFGCPNQGCIKDENTNNAVNQTEIRCEKCQASLTPDQIFCPECGEPIKTNAKKVCSKCQTELQEGQMFCPTCGQKADVSIDSSISSAINAHNAEVVMADKKKSKNKSIFISLAVVLVVIGLCSYFVSANLKTAKYEELLTTTTANMYVNAILSELVCDATSTVWRNAIYDDYDIYNKGYLDFNKAISNYYADESTIKTLETISKTNSEIYYSMKQLQNPPEKHKELYSNVVDLYETYSGIYEQAKNPSGNLNSFNQDVSSKASSFTSKYNKVKILLPKVEEKAKEQQAENKK